MSPPAPSSVTFTAEVERVTFENEETSFRVLRVGKLEGDAPRRGPAVVVGVFPAVGPGHRVRVTGQWGVDPRFGEQFRAETLVPLDPETLLGLERYLGSGVLPGVGPGLARRIVKHFGLEVLRVLDLDPERLAEVSGLPRKRLPELREAWTAARGTSTVMLLLQTHGASPALAKRILTRYGEHAAAVVTRSPYRLALEVSGIGFRTADRIAKSLGLSGDHPERAQAGVLHLLGELADGGHVFAERARLVEQATALLEVGEAHVEAAIDALWASLRVIVEQGRVYLARLHAAEVAVCEGLVRLMQSPGAKLSGLEVAVEGFEAEQGLRLAEQQRAAVRAVAEQKLAVITGGPGVGKTTIVRAILRVLEGARLTTRLAAPTGRAAKRMGEATGQEASTLHRLLEYDPKTGGFSRHAERPLECDAVVVDEASMVDLPLAAALIDALPTAARLVIVGDADQLPSVGPGAFLRDLIASAVVPTVRLTAIFRQAEQSRIVLNAHRIFQGEAPLGAHADEPNADFFIVERRAPEHAAETVEELVASRIPRRFGYSALTEIQVLTPMHRGEVGTQALNERLQARLNPQGLELLHRGQTLRVGDRVMQTRNDYEREVFNGDLGVVLAVEAAERTLHVGFDERRVRYVGEELDALQLAYATSIHKSQGSEYPAVVIPLVTAHFVMLSRNLLYTAITRARRLCVLVADPRALRLALDEARCEDRNSGLRARLQGALDHGEPLLS